MSRPPTTRALVVRLTMEGRTPADVARIAGLDRVYVNKVIATCRRLGELPPSTRPPRRTRPVAA